MLALLWLALAPLAGAQVIETNLMQEVISREYSVHIGGIQTPEYKDIVSREFSVFVGVVPPYGQVVSREVSIVVTTPAVPVQVSPLLVTASPTGETVTLSWAGYNHWAQRDLTGYRVYVSDRAFSNVPGMTNFVFVPGEVFTFTFSNLTAWQDHYFAVVAVDALGGFEPEVNYAAAYILAKEVVSRECSVFVGAESNPYREVVSREVSVVVSTPEVPDQVTCLDCGFKVRDSVNAFTGLDLEWTAYNEVGQKDVVGYDIYLGPAFFGNVTGLEPFAHVPAETQRATLTGLVPYGVYHVAVVAVDVLGQTNPVVRSQSAQASVDRVREVRNLAAGCGTNSLTFTWQPPDGADPRSNNLLVAHSVALGTAAPVVLDRWATSYTATDLLPGHEYPFVIRTVDNSNRVSEGASVLAATLRPNPEQTVVNTFYGTTRVAWERLEPDVVIERFLVFMAETNFTSVAGMTPVASTRGHSADFHLVADKPYWFAVTTRNIAGCDSSELPLRVVAHTPGGTTDPTMLAPGSYANGVFKITVNGPVGAGYVLQASENLRDWFPLGTNSPPVMPYTVTVTNVPGLNRFYRVQIQ